MTLTSLLSSDFVLVVVEIFSAKEKAELGVVLLLCLGHLLKLRAITGHKLSQLVDDVFQLLIYYKRKNKTKKYPVNRQQLAPLNKF